MTDENQRRATLDADALLRERDLRRRVADAPVLRRAPGLRAAIVAALDELDGVRRENRELLDKLDLSAGHTADECEADAIQAEYGRLHRRVERLETAVSSWHRPTAPSGRPCVCAGCEDIAAVAAGLDEVVFGQEIDLSHVAFEGVQSEPAAEGRDG